MFRVNFTFANFASVMTSQRKDRKKLNLCEWLLVGVVNGHFDVEPFNVSWLFQEKQR